MKTVNKIGSSRAIQLYNEKWWIGKSPQEIVEFQLFTVEYCCPIDIYKNALETTLNRSITTSDIINSEKLRKQFQS